MKKDALAAEIRRLWKARPARSHKGDYGRVTVLGGAVGYAGAASLAARAALAMGAGLVSLGVPDKIYRVAARKSDEIMVRPFASTKSGSFSLKSLPAVKTFLKNQDVLAVGPGLSSQPETQNWVRRLLPAARQPLVLDADALNALAGYPEVLKKIGARTVITPHPGEFSRLFGKKPGTADKARKKLALEAARKSGAVVVLKGHHTVVAAKSGKIYVNATGNPGMAKAGMGDVLTGMIAGLLGQGFTLWQSARWGVYLHGLSGDLAVRAKGEAGLLAGDLIEYLPKAVLKVRGR